MDTIPFSADALTLTANNIAIEPLLWPALTDRGLRVFLRRDDTVSPTYSGNKFYKLALNIDCALRKKAGAIVSFGGRYSNHIHALAALGHHYQVPTVGIIRGSEPGVLTPTLVDAQRWGMTLHFVSARAYRAADIGNLHHDLQHHYGSYYLLPEGGANLLGVKGCRAIATSTEHHFSGKPYSLCCAVGSGSTFAGIIAGAHRTQAHCLGFSVLKGEDTLSASVQAWLDELGCDSYQWQLINGHHHGGYAKISSTLREFMAEFEHREGMMIEPVYTAKMLWGIEALAKDGFWAPGSTIIAVHSGGLQGRRGYPELLT